MKNATGVISVSLLTCFLMISTFQGMGCVRGDPSLEVEPAEGVLSPMIVGSASIFMLIRNRGNGADTLTGARLDIPETITELHAMRDGRMVKTDAILVAANSAVQLRPFGHHVMVFRLPKETKPGDDVQLSLYFSRSGEKIVPVTFVNKYRNNKNLSR